MARRVLLTLSLPLLSLFVAAPAFACGGLIGPRGSVNLLRTTTFVGYHSGIEHYITSFTFTGTGGGKFGSLVPLPGVPTKVERGGDWTLQRLEREVNPPVPQAAFDGVRALSAGRAQVLLEAKIDALDITVLSGGGAAVGTWARDNGFVLSPDAPEMLDYYAKRSPIFMAARFNQARADARGQQAGDGTPIHLTIPTPTPWVPLRILGLGKAPREFINADVFLLTDKTPSILPAPQGFGSKTIPSDEGMTLARSEQADPSLLTDLHNDKTGSWVPLKDMWLSYLRINTPAIALHHDLAIDATGAGQPSAVAAGVDRSSTAAVRPVVRPVAAPFAGRVPVRGLELFSMLLIGAVVGALIARARTYRAAV